MLLDYHSYYGPQGRPRGSVYLPWPARKPRPRPRQVVRAIMEATLADMEHWGIAHVEAHGALMARLPAVQQQAQAHTAASAAGDLRLPAPEADGAAQVAISGTADFRLLVPRGAGQGVVRSRGQMLAGLHEATCTVAGTTRLASRLEGDLPQPAAALAATASTVAATPITDIDLDAQEDGWTDERLLAAAQLLLDEEED